MSEPDILVSGVSKVFNSGGREVQALKQVDLAIRKGELVCLLGPSGCGKSTLLNAIAGLTRPSSGHIAALGKPVTGPGPERGMVFQECALYSWMTVEKNLAFGLEIKGVEPAAIGDRVTRLLAMLSMTDFRQCYPKHLSAGMRQRVALARVLALDSPIMLMDEPFGALDEFIRRNLQDELLRIRAELKKTILFATRGIDEAICLADRIVLMTDRPGTIRRDILVDLPRPRDPAAPGFQRIKRELTALMTEEQLRHDDEEIQVAAVL
jgi:NitT/TauT family transport system ATP-binding protein